MASISSIISLADKLIDHTDLLHLECCCLYPPSTCSSTLVLFTLQEDVPLSANLCVSNMLPLLGSLYFLDIDIGYLIKVTSNKVSTFLIISLPSSNCTILGTLFTILKTQYPKVKKQFIHCIPLADFKIKAISSLTFLPDKHQNSPSILPSLFSLFPDRNYSLLFLGTPLDQCKYLDQKKRVFDLYESLFPFKEQHHSHTDTTSQCITKSCSESETRSNTDTTTDNISINTTQSVTENNTTNLNFTPKISEKASISQNNSSGCTDNQSTNETKVNSNSCSNQKSNACTNSTSDAVTTTESHTLGSRAFNREVDAYLQKIEILLKTFELNFTLPLFDFSVYFLSRSISTSLTLNTFYTSLIQPTTPTNQNFYVNSWHDHPSCVSQIQCYLATLRHPLFSPPSSNHLVSPTLTLNNYEFNQLVFACPPKST